MANLRYFNNAYSKTTGMINRAKQLVKSQFRYLEEHPHLAPRNYRQLRNIATQLDEMSTFQPTKIDLQELNWLLDDLSFIVGSLHSRRTA